MTDKPPRPSLMVVAFGVAILAATFRAMQVGLWDTTNVFAFAIAYGSTLVLGYGVLSGPVAFTGMLADSQANLTEKAKHIHTAKTLGDPQVGQAATATVENAVNAREEKWRGWLIGHLTAIRDGTETGPHYSHGLDAVMDYALWRKAFANPLVGMGILSEITERQKTVWMSGYDAATAIGAVRVAVPLPHVAEFDPPNTEHNNTEKAG